MRDHSLDIQKLLPHSAHYIADHLLTWHYADAIDVINLLDLDKAVDVIANLPIDYAIELFDKPELTRPEEIMQHLPLERTITLLDGMSTDEASNVFQKMDPQLTGRLLGSLLPETRKALTRLSDYPQGSAGSLMTTEFLAVPESWTVQQVMDHIREVESSRETIYAIYVLGVETGKLIKAISLRNLVTGDPQANIMMIGTDKSPITISPMTDREDVVHLFRRYDLLAVPVVDNSNHVIGIVTVDDVLDAMSAEMSEDAYKFGGVEAIDKPYLRLSFTDMLKKRGGWLAILFLGEMLTASAMQYFEHELEKAIVLTLFIPLIMSSGGNSGSQATSLIIRALALNELRLRNWFRVALRELPIGLTLGAFLGVIGFIRIYIWQMTGIYDYGEHWLLLGITIFFALIAIVTFGALTGSLLPFLLKKCGFDPASASAPFVATLVDVMGIVIYFSVAALILQGTLL